MDLELNGKVAVVTGASKGIGLAVTRTLAAEGSQVIAGALTIETLEQLDRVSGYAVDLVDPTGPARLVDRALGQHGRIDVLVNNVGGLRPRLDGFLQFSCIEASKSASLMRAICSQFSTCFDVISPCWCN